MSSATRVPAREVQLDAHGAEPGDVELGRQRDRLAAEALRHDVKPLLRHPARDVVVHLERDVTPQELTAKLRREVVGEAAPPERLLRRRVHVDDDDLGVRLVGADGGRQRHDGRSRRVLLEPQREHVGPPDPRPHLELSPHRPEAEEPDAVLSRDDLLRARRRIEAHLSRVPDVRRQVLERRVPLEIRQHPFAVVLNRQADGAPHAVPAHDDDARVRVERVLHQLGDGLPGIALAPREPANQLERIGGLQAEGRRPFGAAALFHRRV